MASRQAAQSVCSSVCIEYKALLILLMPQNLESDSHTSNISKLPSQSGVSSTA